IDVLINNAGFSGYGNFSETDWTREMQMIQVNLVSLTQLTKLFLPGMVARGRGRILNVGSTGSFMPVPLSAIYGATKAYVLSFSEAIAKELEGTGVTVTTLCPGVTITEFQKTAQIEGIRLLKVGAMSARSVAEIGYRGLAAGKKVVIPGAYNKLQVWSVRFTPRDVIATVSKIMMTRGVEK
ncbi:MAG: SDR family NAD(P)-dependent oxidoreductase, partial [Anaerolineales bacterium]